MREENVSDLIAWIKVAREGSFTKAAQAALSYTVRTLARIGLNS